MLLGGQVVASDLRVGVAGRGMLHGLEALCADDPGWFRGRCERTQAPPLPPVQGNRAQCIRTPDGEAGPGSGSVIALQHTDPSQHPVVYRILRLEQHCAEPVYLWLQVGGAWHALERIPATVPGRDARMFIECVAEDCARRRVAIDALRACAGPEPADCTRPVDAPTLVDSTMDPWQGPY